jgi:hypothetical protein
MKKILISWIGRTDLSAVINSAEIGLGLIAQAVSALPFDQIVLLSDYSSKEVKSFTSWLSGIIQVPIAVLPAKLTSPTNFSDIFATSSAPTLKGITLVHSTTFFNRYPTPGSVIMCRGREGSASILRRKLLTLTLTT